MSIMWRSTRSRPSSRCTSAGLLLVEAALATAVIAVGLVFISRAFTSAVRTLQVARLSDTALLLAQQKLAQLEVEGELGDPSAPTFRSQKDGTFSAPYDDFQWSVAVRPDAPDPSKAAAAAEPLISWVTVAVQAKRQNRPVRVSLTTMMPRAWIPAEWGP